MLAAAAEHNRGWGGPLAVLIAVGLFCGYVLYQKWRDDKSKVGNPSPPPPAEECHGEDPQVSEGVTDDDTPDDTCDETPNAWGQIRTRLADGSILVRRAQAVFRTGSSRLPEDDEPAEPVEPEDEGLDELRGETRAQFADRLVASPVRYSDAVMAIMHGYQVSESTAAREIRAARERQQA